VSKRRTAWARGPDFCFMVGRVWEGHLITDLGLLGGRRYADEHCKEGKRSKVRVTAFTEYNNPPGGAFGRKGLATLFKCVRAIQAYFQQNLPPFVG
jgi:hypothetical protein